MLQPRNGMMHKHDWRVCYEDKDHLEEINGVICADPECGNWMDADEIERRINATDYLSAEDAKHQAIEHDCMDNKFRSDLFNHADVLEDK